MASGTIKKDSGFGIAQVILFISIAILVIFVAWPVLLILFNAFFVDGKFNSMDFYKVLTEPETFQALINSLIIASMTTVGSTIVGTFFAWLVTRTDLPYTTLFRSFSSFPLCCPPSSALWLGKCCSAPMPVILTSGSWPPLIPPSPFSTSIPTTASAALR